jgi:hypothetical protein
MSIDFITRVSSLRRLSFGLGLLAATDSSTPSRADHAREVQKVLDDLRALTQTSAATDELHSRRMREFERQIDAAFAVIHSTEGSSERAIRASVCAEPATAFLSTGLVLENGGKGSTALVLHGTDGSQAFAFSSGTSQMNIVAALNSLFDSTGIGAIQCPANPERIQLHSMMVGQAAFVSVMQLGSTPPIIFETPSGGTGTFRLYTNGLDRLPGDVNCDRIVNVADLLLVVQNWGDCPLPPFVCEADLTNDGAVNGCDLLSVVNNWGSMD